MEIAQISSRDKHRYLSYITEMIKTPVETVIHKFSRLLSILFE